MNDEMEGIVPADCIAEERYPHTQRSARKHRSEWLGAIVIAKISIRSNEGNWIHKDQECTVTNTSYVPGSRYEKRVRIAPLSASFSIASVPIDFVEMVSAPPPPETIADLEVRLFNESQKVRGLQQERQDISQTIALHEFNIRHLKRRIAHMRAGTN